MLWNYPVWLKALKDTFKENLKTSITTDNDAETKWSQLQDSKNPRFWKERAQEHSLVQNTLDRDATSIRSQEEHTAREQAEPLP